MDKKQRQTRLVRRITAGVVAGALTMAGGLGLVAAAEGSTTSSSTSSSTTSTSTSTGGSSGLQSAAQAPGSSTGQGSVVSGGS